MERLGASLQSTSVEPESLAFRRGSLNYPEKGGVQYISSLVCSFAFMPDLRGEIVPASQTLAVFPDLEQDLYGSAVP